MNALTPSRGGAVDRLLELLDLERLDDNLFRSLRQEVGWKRVYGGQVLGQALVAATRTVENADRLAHSLHGYFILPGDPNAPIVYQVERARDGGSFTTRRVVAIQHGRPVFNMAASFQRRETGFEHQAAMPDVPGPEGLKSDLELLRERVENIPPGVRDFWLRERAVEFRPIDPYDFFAPEKREPVRHHWVRVGRALPDDQALHRAILAYFSDSTLVATATLPHAIRWTDPKLQVASLDHVMWFHGDFRADEWLLYSTTSPWAGGARGLSFGHVFTREGRLVASTAQEGLIRLRG